MAVKWSSYSSLRFSDFVSSCAHNSSQNYNSDHIWLRLPSKSRARRLTMRIICAATPSKRKLAEKEISERDNRVLVRSLMGRFSDKEPLVKTLDKYVKVVRCEHCFMLFEELGKSDKWLQCLEVFRWMQKQRWYIADNGVYSKLISVMGKKGQTRMAMWLFSEMRNSGCRPDASVYNALITAHLHTRDKAKALEKALGYFNKMKTMERCQPNIVTYNILLRAFAQAGRVDQVNSLLQDLDSSIVSPDIYTFNGVMDAYGKNGMIKEMESILALMKSNQCKPDIITFNLLIDSYGKKQEFEKMEQVFRSLLRSKERPTLPTFNSMIINYGKARLREKAELVFKKMNDMKYRASFITYECLITMYGYCDCVSKAREIFDEIVQSEKELKVSTLNAMLEVYCLNGLHHEAHELFQNARASRVCPDASTYKLLYKAYTKANMKELVQTLMKQMEKDGVVPNKRFFLEALEAFGSTLPGSDSQSKNMTDSTGQKDNAEEFIISDRM
ncbi:PREDICTED: pentatricopeptide repeat-containing protein At4g39620, chloroplastic [Tarenaya hassleriana]|uniref:pentatricopeptide repeat-containing protein At4g39620, chloroplastic n=1 Tax=Tarenaya hassleriana TaxID=28532 RepID=UPI00053C58A7|nr:PREDICTED: pentatricopeptide repeat-containing protein At4g39620, chloroplastic [Tarenaya hassleriana]